MEPPHGLAEVKAAFGDIRVEGGKVVSPRGWESRCMMIVSDLPMVPRRLYINRAIEEPLRQALQRCHDLLDGYVLKSVGCFNPRPKRVNGDLSTHSWGIAVDLNAADNPIAPGPGQPMICDIPDAWVAIWREIGWTWGGQFLRPDPMHFQFCSGY